jgi:hypothetical protein
MSNTIKLMARVNGEEYTQIVEVEESTTESDCDDLAEEFYWHIAHMENNDGYQWEEVPDGAAAVSPLREPPRL